MAPTAVAVHGALRPAVLAEVESAKATAFGLAGLLAVAAVLALAFTLGSSVAQRRSQLAVLAALGFDHRDLRRSIRWQAWCLVGVALLLGLPLGVVVGRLAWTAFAAQIGVTPAPEVPGTVLAGLAVAIALLADRGGGTARAGCCPNLSGGRLATAGLILPEKNGRTPYVGDWGSQGSGRHPSVDAWTGPLSCGDPRQQENRHGVERRRFLRTSMRYRLTMASAP